MPVMDGFEASSEIMERSTEKREEIEIDETIDEAKKQALLNNDIKIVGLSALTGSELSEKCKKVGMREVIAKPVTQQ